MNADPLCAGDPVFNNYTVEVVQRIGYDSFTPDNGVLIAKNKDRQTNSCGYGCHAWVIDAHPEDMKRLDFMRPGGERVMRTHRRLPAAERRALPRGPPSGSEFEWKDEAEPTALLRDRPRSGRARRPVVRVGVRSLDGAGPQARGVRATAPATLAVAGSSTFNVTLRNTGAALPAKTPSPHPQDAAPYLTSDIYRVSVSIDRPEWSASLQNALVSVKAGESIAVPVNVTRGATAPAKVTFVAVSESDPAKTATVLTIVSYFSSFQLRAPASSGSGKLLY